VTTSGDGAAPALGPAPALATGTTAAAAAEPGGAGVRTAYPAAPTRGPPGWVAVRGSGLNDARGTGGSRRTCASPGGRATAARVFGRGFRSGHKFDVGSIESVLFYSGFILSGSTRRTYNFKVRR
jgi:hypothetical protein